MAVQGNVFTVLGVSLKLYNNEDPLKILLFLLNFPFFIALLYFKLIAENIELKDKYRKHPIDIASAFVRKQRTLHLVFKSPIMRNF